MKPGQRSLRAIDIYEIILLDDGKDGLSFPSGKYMNSSNDRMTPQKAGQ
jgi:hypothetical protein